MKLDIPGRVRNISLPASRPLLPLYEAIVNSIHSIEACGIPGGRIDIKVIRSSDGDFFEHEKALREIVAFEVSDNGIGFTKDNYNSFCTSDTQYKASLGGKGIGRFLWLVAFDKVEIQSEYKEDSVSKKRNFSFEKKGEGIYENSETDASSERNLTTVKLLGFKEKYRLACPKKVETLSSHIVEYCLEYFIRPTCPDIILHDDASGDTVNLNEKFEGEMKANSETKVVTIGNHQFEILHVRLYSEGVVSKEHHLNFCAHHRVVKPEKLIGKVPNLEETLIDEHGKSFIYTGYVESDVLDNNVNSERTSFNVSEEEAELFEPGISWQIIREAILKECKLHLKPYVDVIREKKMQRIEKFISDEAPMYKPILSQVGDAIEQIDAKITDKELEIQLYRAYAELQAKIQIEGQELLKKDREENFADYEMKLQSYFEKVTSISASDLARYVCHRKAILEFLSKLLEIQKSGKYNNEDTIHNVIFPQYTTSGEIDYSSHNLWIIDEKLVFHNYLASDKRLDSIAPLASDSAKRPDLISFNIPFAIVPANEPPYPAIVIVEFKKPMRDNYADDDNPMLQVTSYIDDIRAGKALTPQGRPVKLSEHTPFYCYIVCDITKKIEKFAKDYELDKTPDEQGFFGFKKGYNAYIEVISYDKMLIDAKRRNAVFFNKLGLPLKV